MAIKRDKSHDNNNHGDAKYSHGDCNNFHSDHEKNAR